MEYCVVYQIVQFAVTLSDPYLDLKITIFFNVKHRKNDYIKLYLQR